MNKKLTIIATSTPLLAGALLIASHASARLQPGIMGNPLNGEDQSCFIDNTAAPVGVGNMCTVPKQYVMPVVWDTPTGAAKVITLQGSNNAAGGLQCRYFGYNTSGAIIFQAVFPALPAGGPGSSTSSIVVPTVLSGGTGKVLCILPASLAGHVQGLEYGAP